MTTFRAMWRMMTLFSCLAAGPALAHPHVFIDTGIEILLNDRNEATGLRITWTYDDLYSLYIVGDMGLDPDWDGSLTPDEVAKLSGFDMKWIEGFEGDTYALMAGAPLALSGPRDWTAGYAGGKITSTHVRDFAAPVPVGDEPLIVQAYDPGYYTAYSIPGDPVVTGGAGCTAQVFVPDLDEAEKALQAALSEYTPDVDLEAEFPAVGANFAEEVRLTCAAP
jgi:polyphosphate kinase